VKYITEPQVQYEENMRFLKLPVAQRASIYLAAAALAGCGGGGGNNEPTIIGGPPPAPVAGTPASPPPATPPVAGTPTTPPPAGNPPASPPPGPVAPPPSPGTGASIQGFPKDFVVGAFLFNSDASQIKAISALGKIANAASTASSSWALDNALAFVPAAKSIRKARLLNGKSFILGADPDKSDIATVWISTDNQQTWKQASIPANDAPNEFWDIAYGNGRYVVSGFSRDTTTDSGLMQSLDGVNWQNVATPELRGQRWTSIVFGNGLFVAVENATGKTATSSDGLNWTVQTIAQPEPGGNPSGLQSITYVASRSLFVIAANARDNPADQINNSVIGNVYTSTNGTSWTRRNTGYAANMIRIECDATVCVGSTSSSSPRILVANGTDPDKWVWSQINYFPVTQSQFITSIARSNSGWLAGGLGGLLVTSADGLTWTNITPRP
jgi:hypothetical protein